LLQLVAVSVQVSGSGWTSKPVPAVSIAVTNNVMTALRSVLPVGTVPAVANLRKARFVLGLVATGSTPP